MISHKQRKLLMVAKKALGLSEDAYRASLASVGVASSTELNNATFGQLIKSYESIGFNASPVNTDREGCATHKQIRYIQYLWSANNSVRDKSPEALAHFCKRILGIDSLDWIPRDKVERLIKAIKSLK